MDPQALTLLWKLILASAAFWGLLRIVPIVFRAVGLLHRWTRLLFPGAKRTTRLARLRPGYGSPSLSSDSVSDAALLGMAFGMVESGKIDAARHVVCRLRSRGCSGARLTQLETAILTSERRQGRRKQARAARASALRG